MADKNLGRVVGKSAYEIAVDNGFKGTEKEWLATIGGVKTVNGVAPDENGNVEVEGGSGSSEQLTNLSMVKSDNTITITSTLEGDDTVVDTITLTNGVPTSGVFNGVACTIEMEGF